MTKVLFLFFLLSSWMLAKPDSKAECRGECVCTVGSELNPWELRQLLSNENRLIKKLYHRGDFEAVPRVSIDFTARAKDKNDLIRAASSLSIGAQKLREATSRLQSGKLRIELVSASQIQSVCRAEAGACFDHVTNSILLDEKVEMGVLIPHFLHELDHALDEDWLGDEKKCDDLKTRTREQFRQMAEAVAKRKGISPKQVKAQDLDPAEKVQFEAGVAAVQGCDSVPALFAERFAYQVEAAAIQGLTREFSCYGRYRKARVALGLLDKDRNPSTQNLIEMYDLSPAVLKKHWETVKPGERGYPAGKK